MNETAVNKEPQTDTIIRFQDCDPFGHLNNARYLDYFINAREDHLADEYDLDIYERQKQSQTNWVIAKTKIAYISPAYFREKISVRTRLIAHTDHSLLMEGVMTKASSPPPPNLKAVTWIKFRHFNLAQGKPAKHSEELMSLFDKITIRGLDTQGFDARVKDLLEGIQTGIPGLCP